MNIPARPRVKTYDEAVKRYGVILNGKWQNERYFMVFFRVPPEITSVNRDFPSRIYCNVDMLAALTNAFQNLIDRGLEGQLKTFDGCFNIRNVRGSNRMSTHSYGLAIDLNAAENGLGEKPALTREFVSCFVDAGFAWGGDFERMDGMHFSYAWE